MNTEQFVYSFIDNIESTDLEDALALAALATASLHGDVAVSLDASYALNVTTRTCAIHTGTPIGKQLNRIFYGFAVREFGPDAFTVEQQVAPCSAGGCS